MLAELGELGQHLRKRKGKGTPVISGQGRLGHVKSGRTGQAKSSLVMSGQDKTWQDRVGQAGQSVLRRIVVGQDKARRIAQGRAGRSEGEDMRRHGGGRTRLIRTGLQVGSGQGQDTRGENAHSYLT